MPKILVVDDEESIRFSFKRMLTDAGYPRMFYQACGARELGAAIRRVLDQEIAN